MNRRRVVLPALLAVSVFLTASVVSAQVVQIPLKVNQIPQFIEPLPVLAGLPGMPANGIPVIVDSTYDLSMCEFQNKILSAMRFGFGGHHEKPAAG